MGFVKLDVGRIALVDARGGFRGRPARGEPEDGTEEQEEDDEDSHGRTLVRRRACGEHCEVPALNLFLLLVLLLNSLPLKRRARARQRED